MLDQLWYTDIIKVKA